MSAKRSELKQWAKENMKGVENLTLPSFTRDLSELDEEGIRWDVRKSIEHGFFPRVVLLNWDSPLMRRKGL